MSWNPVRSELLEPQQGACLSLVPAARRPEGSYLPETDAAREFREQMVTPPQRRRSGHRCPVCRRPTPGGRNATRAACLVTRGPSGTPAPFSVAWPPSQLPRGSACHLRGQPSWEPPRHLPRYLDQTTKDTRLLREATGDQRPHTRDDCLGRRPQGHSLAARQLPPRPHRRPSPRQPTAPARRARPRAACPLLTRPPLPGLNGIQLPLGLEDFFFLLFLFRFVSPSPVAARIRRCLVSRLLCTVTLR